MDKLNAMRTFCAVIDAGSFATAAHKLGLSTSAVSRLVAQLEADLQTRLLQRTTRYLSLTESGKLYAARCRQLIEDIEDMESSAREQTVLPGGTLKIATSIGFAMHYLAGAMAAFSRQYPTIGFNVALNGRAVDLVEDGFDLALRIGHLGSDDVVAQRIGTTTLLLAASPDYLTRTPPIYVPEDLAQHAYLTYEHDADDNCILLRDRLGNAKSISAGGPIHCDNGDFLVELAAQGLGITWMPDFIMRHHLREGRLTRLLPEYDCGELGIFAVYPSRKHVPAKVRTFIAFLADWLAQQQKEG